MIRLALRVRRADAELALAELLELVPEGLEEVDCGDEVEFAIYGAPGELPELPELRAHVGGALASISTTDSPTTGPSDGARFTDRSCSTVSSCAHRGWRAQSPLARRW